MSSTIIPCAGPLTRRGFMRVGLAGFASLSWPGLLRLRAENAGKPAGAKTAVIMVWLPGGLSHLDSYDPKPEIGSEYRGPFSTIPTKVPGMRLTELLPMQAKIADTFRRIGQADVRHLEIRPVRISGNGEGRIRIAQISGPGVTRNRIHPHVIGQRVRPPAF